ncbi:MAG: hypothetical protein PHW54_02500, partial [Candidatus Omnitrophica bacterium]|nr:hypothetical protein [Candidatus Omnitrophota bacterium]
VFYKEGIVSSVGVFKQGDIFTIKYSERTQIPAETSPAGRLRSNHRLKAHIPMVLHSNPHAVVNIGFGTGVTAYSLSLHNNIERVDNVEICAETFDAKRFFINNSDPVFDNPKVNLIVDDGRNFLFLTKRKYDVILVYPFSYVFSDTIFLFTKDFLQLCKNKLNPGGVIAVFFPITQNMLVENKIDHSKVLLKTFSEVFPHFALFSTLPLSPYIGGGASLIGTVDPGGINFSPEYLKNRFKSLSPEVKTELMISNINNAEDLLKHLILDKVSLEKIYGPIKDIVTDNRTIIDYRGARLNWSKRTGNWLQYEQLPPRVDFEKFLYLQKGK